MKSCKRASLARIISSEPLFFLNASNSSRSAPWRRLSLSWAFYSSSSCNLDVFYCSVDSCLSILSLNDASFSYLRSSSAYEASSTMARAWLSTCWNTEDLTIASSVSTSPEGPVARSSFADKILLVFSAATLSSANVWHWLRKDFSSSASIRAY